MVLFRRFSAAIITAGLLPRLIIAERTPSEAGSTSMQQVYGPGLSPMAMMEISNHRVMNRLTAIPMDNYVGMEQQRQKDEEPTPTNQNVMPEVEPQAVPMGATERLASHYRQSVVRIYSIEKATNWFEPYIPGQDLGAIGTGFAVEFGENASKTIVDPVFVTNAHVVKNAHTVQIQLPSVSHLNFDAYVPLIYEDFDLALVRLVEPAVFLAFLEAQGMPMQVLPINKFQIVHGLDVVAVGYPLGSQSLKLSKGIIAGTEQVDGRLCYQSTAPISPGSSGGPLLATTDIDGNLIASPKVIGVNFASSGRMEAQNANYVVPVVHIRQLLHVYKESQVLAEEQSKKGQAAFAKLRAELYKRFPQLNGSMTQQGNAGATNSSGNKTFAVLIRMNNRVLVVTRETLEGLPKTSTPRIEHNTLRFPPIDAIIIEGNDALYNSSKGCTQGVYVTKLDPQSPWHQATTPPLPETFFLTMVNNVSLDNFGYGRTDSFLGDPLSFESLMSLGESVKDPVNVEVCHQGRRSSHIISMLWRDEYVKGIPVVTEPEFQREMLDYEIFADITIMQMTMNHVVGMLQGGLPASFGRWMLPGNMVKPQLLIVHVKSGTYASRVLAPGMVITAINGKNVSTLADFRQSFLPAGPTWRLETELGALLEVMFGKAFIEQWEMIQAAQRMGSRSYLCTTMIDQLAKAQGIANGCTGQSTGNPGGESKGLQAIFNSFARGLPRERTNIAKKNTTSATHNFKDKVTSLLGTDWSAGSIELGETADENILAAINEIELLEQKPIGKSIIPNVSPDGNGVTMIKLGDTETKTLFTWRDGQALGPEMDLHSDRGNAASIWGTITDDAFRDLHYARPTQAATVSSHDSSDIVLPQGQLLPFSHAARAGRGRPLLGQL